MTNGEKKTEAHVARKEKQLRFIVVGSFVLLLVAIASSLLA